MNKKLLVLAGIMSVLSMNGITIYADSTVSTNYPTYQGIFIGTGGDINHGVRIESDGMTISDTVEANAGHPDDRHTHISAGHFDMYNGTHELVCRPVSLRRNER